MGRTKIELEHEGVLYTWTEDQGFFDRRFQRPPDAVRRRLEAKLQPLLTFREERIGGAGHAIREALAAKKAAQPARAERLLRLALELEPWNERAATILCSVLRDQRRPREAVEVAEAFPSTDSHVLLTTRAAALADVGELKEANRIARWAWKLAKQAKSSTEPIAKVLDRIRAEDSAKD